MPYADRYGWQVRVYDLGGDARTRTQLGHGRQGRAEALTHP
ncbi:hypothetical protein [Micromonospora sp. NBC_01796]|nr:hypothetical protein [Micromonospora sp. NBC_01796]WSA85916.1 hypothetical protein OIE47_37185 [Micromonospora sp. NBC_01796]